MDSRENNINYFQYWGKAKREAGSAGPAYHLLPYHCLDVAAVGRILLDSEKPLCQSLAKQLGVEPVWLQNWFTFCLVLHDIGKFFRAFQNLAPNLSDNLVAYVGQCVYGKRHDTLGFTLWRNKLAKNLADVFTSECLSSMEVWLEISCGHHGQPPEKLKEFRPFLLAEDEQAAEMFVRDVIELWPVDPVPLSKIDKHELRRISWQLAGVAVLADWLGSNQTIFHYHDDVMPLGSYWQQIALTGAEKAVQLARLSQRHINPFTSINQQFDFISESTATPLQQYAQAAQLGGGPQLFILEDVTGAGKTEAAMVLVHRLMAAGLANGVYVGLPTMATANAMYERMAKSYRRLYAESELPSLILAHGARELSQSFTESVIFDEQKSDNNYDKGELSASAYCNYWLADNRKKALLADVGIGTIDQALLGVLPARHQSLRLLGLTGKVLLVDEVHAFDPYVRQLLAALLQAHAEQGGSAILLSATLPFKFRASLVNAFAQGAHLSADLPQNQLDYPLATHLSGSGLKETAIATRDSVKRHVSVQRLQDEIDALAVIEQAVTQGQCICWIRNTVKDANASYQWLAEQSWIDSSRLTLFHSRYAMIDRQHIEQDVLDRFGKTSSHHQRKGQVLIATQVVEQSLDLDFDIMISDLAPMDLLIQRAGRLQRHLRNADGDILANGEQDQRSPPCLYVLAPNPEQVNDKNWLRECLSGTQAVYPHVGQLWLTLQVLLKNRGFSMPEDARALIEAVYSEVAQQNIPVELEQASAEALAEQHAMRSMGEFNCLKLEKGYTRSSAGHNSGWSEEVHIPTRLGSDTVTIALAQVHGNELVPYARHENLKHAWALSQISLPMVEWNKVNQLIPDSLKQLTAVMREKTPSIRWIEILPLTEQTQSLYSAQSGWGSLQSNRKENV